MNSLFLRVNYFYFYFSEYSPETPQVLSIFQFFGGIFNILSNLVEKFFRIGVVSIVWLILIPLITIMLLKLYLVDSYQEFLSVMNL
jgi:hypothetical protein